MLRKRELFRINRVRSPKQLSKVRNKWETNVRFWIWVRKMASSFFSINVCLRYWRKIVYGLQSKVAQRRLFHFGRSQNWIKSLCSTKKKLWNLGLSQQMTDSDWKQKCMLVPKEVNFFPAQPKEAQIKVFQVDFRVRVEKQVPQVLNKRKTNVLNLYLGQKTEISLLKNVLAPLEIKKNLLVLPNPISWRRRWNLKKWHWGKFLIWYRANIPKFNIIGQNLLKFYFNG